MYFLSFSKRHEFHIIWLSEFRNQLGCWRSNQSANQSISSVHCPRGFRCQILWDIQSLDCFIGLEGLSNENQLTASLIWIIVYITSHYWCLHIMRQVIKIKENKESGNLECFHFDGDYLAAVTGGLQIWNIFSGQLVGYTFTQSIYTLLVICCCLLFPVALCEINWSCSWHYFSKSRRHPHFQQFSCCLQVVYQRGISLRNWIARLG